MLCPAEIMATLSAWKVFCSMVCSMVMQLPGGYRITCGVLLVPGINALISAVHIALDHKRERLHSVIRVFSQILQTDAQAQTFQVGMIQQVFDNRGVCLNAKGFKQTPDIHLGSLVMHSSLSLFPTITRVSSIPHPLGLLMPFSAMRLLEKRIRPGSPGRIRASVIFLTISWFRG